MGRIAGLALVSLLVACGSNEGGGDYDADVAPECVENADCDDGNQCTFNWCDSGSCVAENEAEGLECDDGDKCTVNDECRAGACVADAVDCSGLSDVCNDGVCDGATGECTVQAKDDGTACDDALFCTDNDECVSGSCVGDPRDCSSLDSDCSQGVCDEDGAACVAMAINESGACDDGLFCTDGDTCTAGTCSGSALDCSSATDQCNTGVCDELADACVGDPVTDGTLCNDGFFCTPTDQCLSGTCTGSGSRDCSGLNNQCNVGVCDDDIDACAAMPANEGGACNDGKFCTTGEVCTAGICTGGGATACDDSDACTTDTCNTVSDACAYTPVAPIPGAEGPPGDATCSDGEDNDCDGATDGADVNCTGCTSDPECNDGNVCTTDTCNLSTNLCEYSGLTGGGCSDGSLCTTGDTCNAGACVGTPVDCSSLDDACNVGTCNTADGTCVKVAANEGGGCSDGVFCTNPDSCTAGVCGGPSRDCSAFDGPCAIGTCDEGGSTCFADPVADTTPCNLGFCTDGETCTGGVCGGGTPHDCGDVDACTMDSCDEVGDACVNDALLIDTSSAVFTSATGTALDVCLVAGSGARVVIWTDLVDVQGDPITGASVTIGGVSATESSARPGTYYIEHVAAGSPSTDVLEIDVTACADSATLTSVVTVENAAANTTLGGTGGCSPMHGNLRVRVVDETGAPLMGASVLVGDTEGTPFEHSAEALFGGASSMATNVATTDASGYASFYDYTVSLDGPVKATAGATDRALMTIIAGNASDLVLPLSEVHPPEPGTSRYSMGTSSASPPNCGALDAAVILPHVDIDFVGTFETSDLFGPNRCWDRNGDPADVVLVPENVWIPDQDVGVRFIVCIGEHVAEAPWALTLNNTADTGVTEDLAMTIIDAPIGDVLDILSDPNASIADLLPVLTYNEVGFDLDVNVAGDVSPNSISVADDYPNDFVVTYSGKPVETDVIGISAADYDGTNGIGPMFLLGTDLRPFTDGGSQVSLPNSNLDGAGSPAGIRRVGSLTALYLDEADHPGIDAAHINGVSSVFLRDNGMGGAAFGPGGGSLTLTTLWSPFLDIAGATFTAPASFVWENATNGGNLPLFSVHELNVLTREYLPVLSCATENEVRDTRTTHWVVIKPFAADCGGSECFDLPTLPSSFPRATPGTQKRPGMEQYVGSGAACGGCLVAGEACVDPDGGAGAAGSMCMGGAGTAADPYFTQEYEWLMHIYDLELAPTFDFNAFDFDDRRLYMTHESTNRIPIN